jgi:branched-chain amino acid transport system substrate-binding protein
MADDSLLRTFGDESVGLISASPYSAEFDLPANRKFVEGMVRDTGNMPGIAAACLYINGMVAEAALNQTGGSTDDKEAFMRALRTVALTDSPRGAFHFDHFGNIFIRRRERKGDKLINTIVKTYPDISQFWTYDEKWFLSQPVYSRDYPPLKS